MFNILNSTLPDYKIKPSLILIASSVFVLMCLLAYLFWGLFKIGFKDIFLIIIGYTIITGVCTSFHMYLFSKLYKNQWNLGRYITGSFAVITTIWICNSIFSYYFTNFNKASLLKNFEELFILTYALGIIPTAGFYFLLKYSGIHTFLKEKEEENQKLIFRVLKENTEQKLITLCGASPKESLTLFPQELLYLESTGNYVRINYTFEEKVLQKTFRTTLSKMEETLNEYPFLARCHRAFIVNLYRMKGMNGSKIRLESVNTEIPVSKTYKADFQNQINTLGILSQQ